MLLVLKHLCITTTISREPSKRAGKDKSHRLLDHLGAPNAGESTAAIEIPGAKFMADEYGRHADECKEKMGQERHPFEDLKPGAVQGMCHWMQRS